MNSTRRPTRPPFARVKVFKPTETQTLSVRESELVKQSVELPRQERTISEELKPIQYATASNEQPAQSPRERPNLGDYIAKADRAIGRRVRRVSASNTVIEWEDSDEEPSATVPEILLALRGQGQMISSTSAATASVSAPVAKENTSAEGDRSLDDVFRQFQALFHEVRAERDTAISEKNVAITQRDNVIHEREKAIAERDKAREELVKAKQERNRQARMRTESLDRIQDTTALLGEEIKRLHADLEVARNESRAQREDLKKVRQQQDKVAEEMLVSIDKLRSGGVKRRRGEGESVDVGRAVIHSVQEIRRGKRHATTASAAAF